MVGKVLSVVQDVVYIDNHPSIQVLLTLSLNLLKKHAGELIRTKSMTKYIKYP